MTLNEEECAQKWSTITQKLADIEALIKDLVGSHQKSAEMENIDIAKLHHSAAFAMTELEKCKNITVHKRKTLIFPVKLRFNLTNQELKEHAVQIENVKISCFLCIVFHVFRIGSKSIKKRLRKLKLRKLKDLSESIQKHPKGQLNITPNNNKIS